MAHLLVMAVIIQFFLFFLFLDQRSTDFKNIAIVHVKNNAYRIYFKDISEHKAKKLMYKFDLIGKTGDIYYND